MTVSPAPTIDPVVAVGHPGEGGHRLALRAGAHQHDLVVGQVVDLLEVDEQAVGHRQVAEVAGDAHVADHRAADERDLAAVRRARRRAPAAPGARARRSSRR